MKYLSLFSGIGGFELGIQQAYDNRPNLRNRNTNVQEDMSNIKEQQNRSTCIGFSEIDKYAIQTYQKHYPTHHNYGDITRINADELPDFDLLVGGFPCQAFSIAGKRKGFEDTRGTLFFEIARILKAKQPRLFCLENVKGLLSHDNGNTFRTIVSTLNELGYDLQWQVLNSKNHGVPQNRERVFIIGHLRGTCRPEVFPFGRTDEKIDGTDRIQSPTDERLISRTLLARDFKDPKLVEVPPQIRRLTPTECERLQGFPDNWTIGSDTQRYKQCGNAVTVNVIKDIMERLL